MRITMILSLLLLLGCASPAWCNAYLDAGCASADREWRAIDYTALASLIESKKVPLPLLKDTDGSKVIQRLCSAENLSYGQNRSLPLVIRIQDFLGVQTALGAITKRFATEVIAGSHYSGEMSLLMCQNIRVAALGIDLMDEFVPTIKKDETYETRMEGLRKMKSGLATIFTGAYTSVAEDTIYSDAERTAMLAVIAGATQKFASTMSPDTKTEMTLKFTKLRDRFTSPKDRESIDAIRKALE